MFYHRPAKIIKYSKECLKAANSKHRRPFDKKEIKLTFIELKELNVVQFENSANSKSIIKTEENVDYESRDEEENQDCVDGSSKMETEVASENNRVECTVKIKEQKPTETLDIKDEKMECNIANALLSNVKIHKEREKKLVAIIKKLTDRANSGLSRFYHIRTSHQQHVSPRKRILREFEKVSLDDIQAIQKRSRAKTGVLTTLSSVYDGQDNRSSLVSLPERSISPESTANPQFDKKIINDSNNKSQLLDTHTITSSGTSSIPVLLFPQHKPNSSCFPLTTSAVPLVSQSRISSYSITSLLGHESSSSTSFAANNHIKNENSRVNLSVDTTSSQVSPPSTDSLYSSACTPSSSNKKRSPSYSTPSPLNNVANSLHGLEYYAVIRSPDLSPSPEHQIHPSGFPRYRSPSTYNMVHASSSSPQSYSAGLTPIRSSPSPSNSESYTTKFKSSYLSESPNHHPYATVSPSHRYSPKNGYQNRNSPLMLSKATIHSPTRALTTSRQSATSNTSPNLSPTIEEPVKMNKEALSLPGVRNLPKKTAVLRQQFQQSNATSPTGGSFNSMGGKGHSLQKEREKEQNEAEYRAYPSVVHSGMPGIESLGPVHLHGSYPAATASMYQYMFPPGAAPHNSYLNSPLSSYYQQVYAAAAVYRNPLNWMHYPSAIAGPPPHSHLSMSERLNAPHSSSWSISEQSPSSRPSGYQSESGVYVKEPCKELNPGIFVSLCF